MKKKSINLKAIYICFFSVLSIHLNGQIGIGVTGAVNSTAALEVTSTTKGLLPPRLTLTQRNAITSPASGLIIYNTTSSKLNIYEDTAWFEMSAINKTETFTGNKTFAGNLILPKAKLYYLTATTYTTATIIATNSWSAYSTSPTDWVIVPFPAAGDSVGFNTIIDSTDGLFLGARVNHNNLGPGAGIIAYADGGIPRTLDITVNGSFKSSAAGFLNMVFGIFKNGVLLPESVFVTTNSATATTNLYFSIKAITPVVASDYFDLRVIGHDGAPTVTYLTFRNIHFSATAY